MKSKQIAETISFSEDIQPMEMKTASLKVELQDVWGGDGNTRFQRMTKTTLDRTKKTKKTKSTMPDYSGESERGELVEIVQNKEINTFEERAGIPQLYLGRKIWGTLKQIGTNLARMENPLFPSISFCKDMMTMISVTPETIELAGKDWRNDGNYYLGSSGQEMARGGTFIPLYFDAFKKVNTETNIRYPACFDKQIKTAINLLPTMKTGNRRMMKIVIKECGFS